MELGNLHSNNFPVDHAFCRGKDMRAFFAEPSRSEATRRLVELGLKKGK